MALESGTYVSDLVVSNPAGSDNMSQADDHIRLIKQVLKNTFPNITGAVSSTHTQLNQGGLVPIGAVLAWSGSISALPTGYRLCDGTTVTRTDGGGSITLPDLRNKFIAGAAGSNAVPTTGPTTGATGGAVSANTAVSLAAYALTQGDLPNCSFPVTEVAHTHTAASVVTDPGHTHTVAINSSNSYYPNTNAAMSAGGSINTGSATTGISVATTNTAAKTNLTVASGGSGTAHNHTVTQSTIPTLPPYYTLAFICKI